MELLLTGIILAAVAGQTRGASVSRLAASYFRWWSSDTQLGTLSPFFKNWTTNWALGVSVIHNGRITENYCIKKIIVKQRRLTAFKYEDGNSGKC